LSLATSLEHGSEHPLAAAIITGAHERGIKAAAARDFRSIPGKGVVGTVDGQTVALTNRALLDDFHIDRGELAEQLESR
jgi:P-type Cu+ transporter